MSSDAGSDPSDNASLLDDQDYGMVEIENPGDGRGKEIPKHERTTTRFMTKYERARVLGTRALQIR
jgi:hypothetical protein